MAHAQDVPLPQDTTTIHYDLSGIQTSIEKGLVFGLSELGDRLTVNNYITKGTVFDGNSSDKLRLLFCDVDRIYQDTKNDKISLSAASLLLAGPASNFFHLQERACEHLGPDERGLRSVLREPMGPRAPGGEVGAFYTALREWWWWWWFRA